MVVAGRCAETRSLVICVPSLRTRFLPRAGGKAAPSKTGYSAISLVIVWCRCRATTHGNDVWSAACCAFYRYDDIDHSSGTCVYHRRNELRLVLICISGASTGLNYQLLNPFLGVLLSYLILGEPLRMANFIGAGLIVSGLILKQFRQETGKALVEK